MEIKAFDGKRVNRWFYLKKRDNRPLKNGQSEEGRKPDISTPTKPQKFPIFTKSPKAKITHA